MKIHIEQIPEEQEESIIIRCHDPGDAWVIRAGSVMAPETVLPGTRGNSVYRIRLQDICYFEVVEGKSFLYTEKEVYESRLKLYEFESCSHMAGFFRVSKSLVLNLEKIDHIEPTLSGRFHAILTNGEKIVVSRQYVSDLKRYMQLKE